VDRHEHDVQNRTDPQRYELTYHLKAEMQEAVQRWVYLHQVSPQQNLEFDDCNEHDNRIWSVAHDD
jgi:hypothetical protein